MLTLKLVAAHLALTPESVRKLRDRGTIPDPRRSHLDEIRWQYIKHLRERAAGRMSADGKLDLAEERARLAVLQQTKAELDIAERRRELIPAHEIGARLSMVLVALKSALQGLPTRIRQQAPHLDAHAVKALQDGIDDALHEFSDALDAMVGEHPEPADEPDATA